MVYFIQAADNPQGDIRIGFSTDIDERLMRHQMSSPVELWCILLLDAPRSMETVIHRGFRKERRRRGKHRKLSSWFRASSDLLQFVEEMKPYGINPNEQ